MLSLEVFVRSDDVDFGELAALLQLPAFNASELIQAELAALEADDELREVRDVDDCNVSDCAVKVEFLMENKLPRLLVELVNVSHSAKAFS